MKAKLETIASIIFIVLVLLTLPEVLEAAHVDCYDLYYEEPPWGYQGGWE